MEYFVLHTDRAREIFGENPSLSRPKQISLWTKEFLLHKIKEKGLSFNTEIGFRQKGKPFFLHNSELFFSISHTQTHIAIALSNREIGIDIESRRKCKLDLCKRFFHQKEYDFLSSIQDQEERDLFFTKIWTMKEAYVKCTGDGIADMFKSFYVEVIDNTITINKNTQGVNIFHNIEDDDVVLSICEFKNIVI